MSIPAKNAPAPTLAIHGGAPAIAEGPPTWPVADEAVHTALESVWSDGSWGRYHGPHCERLAAELSQRHGAAHVLLCCSGTYAVEGALRGLGVAKDDEVMLAGYDFAGNFRAVEAVGARPVLVDIDPRTWSLDPCQLDSGRTDKTRAVIVSHLHGGMVPMQEVMQWARANGIGVVEDACQAPGAAIGGRPAGTSGDVGVLSFGGSKLLTAGRGGALLTSREDIYQRAKIYAHRGNDAFPLSELQAAVLLPQLDRLDERNGRRRQNVDRLLELTADLTCLRPLDNRDKTAEPVYYKLPWLLDSEKIGGVPRQSFIAAVQAEGVALDAGFRGFVGRSQRRCRRVGTLPGSSAAAEFTVLLHHPVLLTGAGHIKEHAIKKVAEALTKVVAGLATF